VVEIDNLLHDIRCRGLKVHISRGGNIGFPNAAFRCFGRRLRHIHFGI
jgi:hypothetical protein